MTVIQEIEKKLIIDGLIHHQGNQLRVAQDLRLPKSTLHDRIRTYGIDKTKLIKPEIPNILMDIKSILEIK